MNQLPANLNEMSYDIRVSARVISSNSMNLDLNISPPNKKVLNSISVNKIKMQIV